MEALEVIFHSLSVREILRGLILCALLHHFVHPNTPGFKRHTSWTADAISFGGFFFLYLVGRAWLAVVDEYVPEPYLDEVFHIPQAQTYCRGKYFDWDDKITTPPGLYIISLLLHKLRIGAECTAFNLRGTNLPAAVLAALQASVCRNALEVRAAAEKDGKVRAQTFSFYSYHTAINIALFPALFFFSALFYTDVTSTVLVLIAYNNHLTRLTQRPSPSNDIYTVIVGVLTLLMRQTNVFWVVVYMGGMEAFHAIRSLKGDEKVVKEVPGNTLLEVTRFYLGRYAQGDIHDPPLNISYPDDYFFCVLSYGIAALANPVKVLKQVWPYVAVLGLFAGFVAWNGSVVLGDKSNHVATIHLSQMLYIWPFFAFFSAPLVITSLINLPTKVWHAVLGPQTSTSHVDLSNKAKSAGSKKSFLLHVTETLFAKKLYYIPYLFTTLLLSLAIVHFNTIIHPFTLADNRHYMFYVFRYTIRRPGTTRYLLVAAYTISRWIVWGRLAGCSPYVSSSSSQKCPAEQRRTARYINTPFPTDLMKQMKAPVRRTNKEEADLNTAADPAGAVTLGLLDEPTCSSTSSPSTSTVLLWLLTTTLSLVTAPLVEPRYFILPWVFWRLLVPAWSGHDCQGNQGWLRRFEDYPVLGWLVKISRKIDLTAVLETVWFLAINLGTMYIFIFKPYRWFSESGELLDQGRLQRFMW